MAPFTIDVEGHLEIPHHAQKALIHVSVTSSGVNKAAVSDSVLTTSKHVEDLLKDLSPADDTQAAKEAASLAHWSKTSLSSTSYQPWDYKLQEARSHQYNASIKFDIRFKKFKELGYFGSKLSALEHTEVTNIDWILTAATEKSYRSQLRKAAVQNALEKAQDYCEALGCTNLQAVKLEETKGAYSVSALNQRSMNVSIQEMQLQMAQAEWGMHIAPGHSSQGLIDHRDEGVLEFRPQEIRMNMSVGVKFHAECAFPWCRVLCDMLTCLSNYAPSSDPFVKIAGADDTEMSEQGVESTATKL